MIQHCNSPSMLLPPHYASVLHQEDMNGTL
jgi:hypothetical protein